MTVTRYTVQPTRHYNVQEISATSPGWPGSWGAAREPRPDTRTCVYGDAWYAGRSVRSRLDIVEPRCAAPPRTVSDLCRSHKHGLLPPFGV
eukprot:7037037-Prymnesium_polylepis.1